jgi:transcriptional regulator with XRE-family HTH domain
MNAMTMQDMIKYQRELLDWTQDDLGKRLDPHVNRAAIQKWEKGTTENIKRTYIIQMAKLFNISPCQLMCFEPLNHDPDKDKICDLINKCYGQEAYELVKKYLSMNEDGRRLAADLISNLYSNPANIQKRDTKRTG